MLISYYLMTNNQLVDSFSVNVGKLKRRVTFKNFFDFDNTCGSSGMA